MRMGHQWPKKKMLQTRNVAEALRNGYTKRTELFHWKKWVEDKQKSVWQTMQGNYENGLTMSQIGVIKRIVFT